MSNDKNLADVQPGGAVRLGDQAERARFEAWASSRTYSVEASAGVYDEQVTRRMWAAWQAALSAKPSAFENLPPEMRPGSPDYLNYLDTESSPAGQGTPDRCAECRHTTFEVHPDGHICVHCKLIAARQPVGEPVGTIRDRDGVFEIELSESAHDTDAGALDGRAVYLAAPPAQAVDLSKMLPAVRNLVVSARSSGGTAGRDAHLCEALDGVEALLPPFEIPAVDNG